MLMALANTSQGNKVFLTRITRCFLTQSQKRVLNDLFKAVRVFYNSVLKDYKKLIKSKQKDLDFTKSVNIHEYKQKHKILRTVSDDILYNALRDHELRLQKLS